MDTFREKVSGFIDALKQRKVLSILAIVAIVAVIPATILLEQNNTDNRQHASGNIQITTPLNAQAGGTIQVGWTNSAVPTPTTAPTPPAGTPYFYSSQNPCVITTVGSYPGSCTVVLTWAQGNAVANGATTSTIKIRPGAGNTTGAAILVGTFQGLNGTVTIPWISPAGYSFDLYYGSETTPRAYPVSVTGVQPYTLRLLDANLQPAGPKTFLNCHLTTAENPPTDPVLPASGNCAYPMPTQLAAGKYKIALYGNDGVTAVSMSSDITVQGTSGTNTTSSILTASQNPCMMDTDGRCHVTITWNASGLSNVRLHLVENNLDLSTQPTGTLDNINWVTAAGATFELYGGGAETPIATLYVKGIPQNTITASSPYCVVNAEGKCKVTVLWSSDKPNISVKVKTLKDPTETPMTAPGVSSPTGVSTVDWITEQGDIFNMYSGSDTKPFASYTVVGIKQNSIGVSSPFCIVNAAGTCSVTVFWSSDQPNINVKVKLPNDPTETAMTDVNGSTPTGVAFPNYITTQGDVFELYSGNTLLNTVTVGGVAQNSIGAVPNPCFTGAGDKCTTTLFWSTVNKNGLVIKVRAHTNDPATANDTAVTGVGLPNSGTIDVDWITAANPTFDLYSNSSATLPLASITVKGLAQNRVTAPTTTCIVNAAGTCTIPVTWSTQNAQNVTLQISVTDGNDHTPTVIGSGPNGTVSVPWVTTQGDTLQLYSGTTPIGAPLLLRGKEAVLTASVNPCITNAQGTCHSTINFDATGLPNVKLTVKQSQDPALDPVIRNGPVKDSVDIPWITQAGDVFQLYSGNDLLKTLVVGGVAQNSIGAAPNPCIINSQSVCTTSVYWSSNQPDISIKVKTPHGTEAESLFATAPAGSVGSVGIADAPWITTQGAIFSMYSGTSTTPIASVTVTGAIGTNTTGVKFNTTATLTGTPNGTTPPKHPSRNAWITLFDTNNVMVATKEGKLTFDATTGKFTGTLDRDSATNPLSIPAGNYTAKLQTPQFLRKNIPGIFAVHSDQSTTLPAVELIAGDTNMDNVLDILDFNNIRSCFGAKMSSAECLATPQFSLDGAPSAPNAPLADLNDDGVVDGLDYNDFIYSIAIQHGD